MERMRGCEKGKSEQKEECENKMVIPNVLGEISARNESGFGAGSSVGEKLVCLQKIIERYLCRILDQHLTELGDDRFLCAVEAETEDC